MFELHVALQLSIYGWKLKRAQSVPAPARITLRQSALARRRSLDFVIRGLDPPAGPKPLRRGEGPRIHPSSQDCFLRWIDCRVKPGNDESERLRDFVNDDLVRNAA